MQNLPRNRRTLRVSNKIDASESSKSQKPCSGHERITAPSTSFDSFVKALFVLSLAQFIRNSFNGAHIYVKLSAVLRCY